jgi:hypothetical protein
MSSAVRSFCSAALEGEQLQTQRREEKKQARAAKRAAEQLLIEALGESSRALVSVDEQPFLVAVRRKQTPVSVSSSVVERLSALWADAAALQERLEQAHADALTAMELVLLEEAGCAPRVTKTLHLAPASGADAAPLSGQLTDVAAALVRSKAELAAGSEEYREEAKRIKARRQEAEALLVQELTELGAGSVKRVNMLNADGSSEAFFLRLKAPRLPPKRRVTAKKLRSSIRERLLQLQELSLRESLARFCSPEFKESFLRELHEQLVLLETPKAEPQEPRVALDRIRKKRST